MGEQRNREEEKKRLEEEEIRKVEEEARREERRKQKLLEERQLLEKLERDAAEKIKRIQEQKENEEKQREGERQERKKREEEEQLKRAERDIQKKKEADAMKKKMEDLEARQRQIAESLGKVDDWIIDKMESSDEPESTPAPLENEPSIDDIRNNWKRRKPKALPLVENYLDTTSLLDDLAKKAKEKIDSEKGAKKRDLDLEEGMHEEISWALQQKEEHELCSEVKAPARKKKQSTEDAPVTRPKRRSKVDDDHKNCESTIEDHGDESLPVPATRTHRKSGIGSTIVAKGIDAGERQPILGFNRQVSEEERLKSLEEEKKRIEDLEKMLLVKI